MWPSQAGGWDCISLSCLWGGVASGPQSGQAAQDVTEPALSFSGLCPAERMVSLETCIHTQLEYSLGIPANTNYKQSP